MEDKLIGSMSLSGAISRPIIPIRDINERIVEGKTTYVTEPTTFTVKAPVKTAQLSVNNINNLILQNTTAQHVMYFTGGQLGQTIHVLGDGNTVIVHTPGKIFLPGGVNKTLLNQVCYSFKLFEIAPNVFQWSMVSS